VAKNGADPVAFVPSSVAFGILFGRPNVRIKSHEMDSRRVFQKVLPANSANDARGENCHEVRRPWDEVTEAQ
jgi:hypothetical protein